MTVREGLMSAIQCLCGAGTLALGALAPGCGGNEPAVAAGGASAAGTPAGGGLGGSAGHAAVGGNTGGSAATGVTGGSGGSAGSGFSGKGGDAAASGSGGANGGGDAGGDAEGGSSGTESGAGQGGSSGTGVSGDAGAAGTAGSAGSSAWTPTFETTPLSAEHYAEGADVGDIDDDGVLDLVAGPIWYQGPSFEVGGTLFDPVPTFTRDEYSIFFLTFVADLDTDGYLDVIGIGDAGGGNGSGTPNAYWYKNPGPANLGDTWQKYPIFDGLIANESPAFADLIGDSKKELVFMTSQRIGYAVPGSTPTEPWTFQALGNTSFGTPYVHGLGVGDVNGDGRQDVVERSGWWEQPASGTTWTRHAVDFGAPLGAVSSRPSNWGGAQMAVFDVDGDGDGDVVAAVAAHRYGLYWFEQEDPDTFTAHEILPTSATAASVSQLHSLAVADMNGDGLTDVIVGKRYYAHPSNNADPGSDEPPLVEWFELSQSGGVTFTPHTIHDDSGTGCNFAVLDVTGEGKPDVFATNKHGTFLHAQR